MANVHILRPEPADQLASEIRGLIARGDKATADAETFYKEAGAKLIKLQGEMPDGVTWETYVKEQCGIGKSRAADLIAMAQGRKTLKDMRKKNQEANQRLRDRQSPSRDGGIQPEPQPSDAPGPPPGVQEIPIDWLKYAQDHVLELMKSLRQSLSKDEWNEFVEWMRKQTWRKK